MKKIPSKKTSDKLDIRMQISLSRQQRSLIYKVKPAGESISAFVRDAVEQRIYSEQRKYVNLDELIRFLTTPSEAEKKIDRKKIQRWFKDIREDNPKREI